MAGHVMDMLQLYAVPQFPDGTIYQQDGAPLHFANIVRIFLVDLGGPVVIILASGSEVRGFDPGWVRWISSERKTPE